MNWGHLAKAFLYEQVVNEKCEIDVVKNEGKFYSVTLKLSSGQDVGESMVHKGFAISFKPQRESPAPPKTTSTVGPGIMPPSSSIGLPLPSTFGILPPHTPPEQTIQMISGSGPFLSSVSSITSLREDARREEVQCAL